MLDTLYRTPAGAARVTCGAHRTDGVEYTYVGGVGAWRCRGCGQRDSLHETTEETVARRKAAVQ